MSLINCPECGNECSTTAASCPQCGYAFIKPVAPAKVIVREVEREDSFPKWIFIPLALLGVVILFVLFVFLRNDDADQRNINVNLAGARQTERNSVQTTSVPTTSQPSTVTVPSTSQPSTVAVPQTIDPQSPPSVTSVPSTGAPSSVAVPANAPAAPDKGTVVMEAKVIGKSGRPQPASKVRFYLLDKDLDSILAEADIRDETGQGLLTAFGLSMVDQTRYREIYQKANNAIKKHVVYSTTSDAAGKAQIKEVAPKNYYLFAVTTTRDGFAIWNSPVFINGGENVLNLSPATLTEVVRNSNTNSVSEDER